MVKHNTMLTVANALEILKDYDIVADGTDNFQTRYLVNDACVLTRQAECCMASIFRFEGQASVFGDAGGAVLPLPVSGAATAGAGALVRGGRSAGDSAGTAGRDPGDRGDQADSGQG